MKRMMHITIFTAACLLAAAPCVSQVNPVLKELEEAFVQLHEKISPSVVNVETTSKSDEKGGMKDLFHFFGLPQRPDEAPFQMPRPRGTGSGLIYDAEGHIITNNHVIEDADTITVRLWNGNEYKAEVKGSDPETDIAVLKIETEEALAVPALGDSDTLRAGQFAIAIGSARGFEGSVSFGHISALGRNDLWGLHAQGLTFQDLIQTDAAINLGNSGGPLCNIEGEIIGINTAIIWGANSIGFAIPVNQIRETVPELITEGKVTRGYLGVAIKDAADGYADALNLPDQKGAFVDHVQPGTPADKAGLHAYDIVRKVNGMVVEDAEDLKRKISAILPGETVVLEIWRDGSSTEKTVQLEERNLARVQGVKSPEVLGMKLRMLTPEIIEKLGLPAATRGVLIEEVKAGSPAEDARLLGGDVILEVAQKPVSTPEELHAIVKAEGQPGKSLLIRYRRGDNEPVITVLKVPGE
jgi:serine protease Do